MYEFDLCDLTHRQQAAAHIAIYHNSVVLLSCSHLRVDLRYHQWPRSNMVGGGLRSPLSAIPPRRLYCIEYNRWSFDYPIYLPLEPCHLRGPLSGRCCIPSEPVSVVEDIGSYGSGLCFVADADSDTRSSRFRYSIAHVTRHETICGIDEVVR